MPPSWKSKDAKGDALPPQHFILGPPVKRGEKIIIYGPGGIGKTLLACLIERTTGPVGFIDLDDSLGVLEGPLVECGLSPLSITGIKDWGALTGALESNAFDGVSNVVVYTATAAQDMAIIEAVRRNPKTEGGMDASSIESYGYGKGYRYLQDTWLDLKYALTEHSARGRNTILIAHDFVSKVPNPDGPDYIRYEPALHQDSAISIRRLMRDWADHMFYIGYDVSVDAADPRRGKKHGKASGSGTRTIYPVETATCMAKSRRLSESIPYEYGDDALWRALFNKPATE